MRERGFSLIELLIVIVVISILVSISTLAFSSYNRKYAMENQTKTLLTELMKHRADALFCKTRKVAKFTRDTFCLYSSAVTSCEPVAKRELVFPLTNSALKISFNENGCAETLGSVCIEGDNGAAIDSVVISTTRMQVGKRKASAGCLSENITTY